MGKAQLQAKGNPKMVPVAMEPARPASRQRRPVTGKGIKAVPAVVELAETERAPVAERGLMHRRLLLPPCLAVNHFDLRCRPTRR